MKEKNKKFNVELHINLKSYSNEFKDLFLLTSKKEISTKKYVFTQQNKELYIILYPNKNTTDIIVSQKLKDIITNYPSIKIISYIKYDENKNSFVFCNSFKYQKKLNIYKPDNCERLWKLLPQQELNLISQNDIIRLGYISLKFDKICFSKNKNYNNDNNINVSIIKEKNGFISSKFSEEEKFCRICFQKGFEPKIGNKDNEIDPLISVCKCEDSMKYVHLSCLKNKINLNIYKKHYKYYDIYLFQNYNCEICLETYPKYIIIDNKKIHLLDIDISNYDNYIICDMIKFDEKNDYVFRIGFLFIHFEEESVIKFGRKKENDVVFNDLSISGYHCELISNNGNIYIKDVGSSYGCLKYVKQDLVINGENEEIINNVFIAGNSKLEVNLVKNEALFNFDCVNFFLNLFDNKCCSSSVNDKSDVDVINNINENVINEDNNGNLEESKTGNTKSKYFEKFEDFDSYNDYVINIDNEKYL